MAPPFRPWSKARQSAARFKPRGLAGLAYRYAVLPLHGYVFRGMLNGIRREAERSSSATV
ncbi:MAG: DUF2867 domain-containing protein [Planctomycetota bacterium]|nr:DUF2867 domain-containing protein [Planctomycetota bacterium]